MDMYGGSIGSPIVISEDEEDAAFVDQQLQYHDEYDLALTPPRESTSYSEARRASGSSFNTEERQAEDGLVIHQSNSPQSTTVNHWEAEGTRHCTHHLQLVSNSDHLDRPGSEEAQAR